MVTAQKDCLQLPAYPRQLEDVQKQAKQNIGHCIQLRMYGQAMTATDAMKATHS